jgi:hypothetical protein
MDKLEKDGFFFQTGIEIWKRKFGGVSIMSENIKVVVDPTDNDARERADKAVQEFKEKENINAVRKILGFPLLRPEKTKIPDPISQPIICEISSKKDNDDQMTLILEDIEEFVLLSGMKETFNVLVPPEITAKADKVRGEALALMEELDEDLLEETDYVWKLSRDLYEITRQSLYADNLENCKWIKRNGMICLNVKSPLELVPISNMNDHPAICPMLNCYQKLFMLYELDLSCII